MLKAFRGGAFPKETGKEMVKLAFPASGDAQVNGIFDPIVPAKPEPRVNAANTAGDEADEEERPQSEN